MGGTLAEAVRWYRRLCREPTSGSYNRISALPIIIEALNTAPRFVACLDALRDHDAILSTDLIRAGVTLFAASTALLELWKIEVETLPGRRAERLFVERKSIIIHGVMAYRYRLSDLGQHIICVQRENTRERSGA